MKTEPARYITVKTQHTRAMGEYQSRCKQEHLPIVYARIKTKYAQVEMDLIYVRNANSFNENAVFKEAMIVACERATGRKYGGFLPGLFTCINRVPIEKVETLMLDFLSIYESHC